MSSELVSMLNGRAQAIENLCTGFLNLGQIFVGGGENVRCGIAFIRIKIFENPVYIHRMLPAVPGIEGSIVVSGKGNPGSLVVIEVGSAAHLGTGRTVVDRMHGLDSAGYVRKIDFDLFHETLLIYLSQDYCFYNSMEALSKKAIFCKQCRSPHPPTE